jgi:hypothetical protein
VKSVIPQACRRQPRGRSGDDSSLRPRQLLLKIHDFLDLHQEPPVNLRQVEDVLDREPGAQGKMDKKDAFLGFIKIAGATMNVRTANGLPVSKWSPTMVPQEFNRPPITIKWMPSSNPPQASP